MQYRKPYLDDIKSSFNAQITEFELSSTVDFLFSDKDKAFEYFSFSIQIPKIDPLAILEQHAHKEAFQYYWENPAGQFAIVAAGTVQRILSSGEGRFKQASEQGKVLLSKIYHLTHVQHHLASVHLLGGFSFFDENDGEEWQHFGSGSFTLPEWLIVRDGEFTVLTITKKLDFQSNSENLITSVYETLDQLEQIFKAHSYSVKSSPEHKPLSGIPDLDSENFTRWQNSLENAIDLIKNKVFDKIVLARQLRLQLDAPVSDTHILNHLRSQYPDCYSFLIRQNEDASFIGCTPERLASFKERNVLTEGLAGSISRGKTASEDALLEHTLLHSQKDLNEHLYVMNAIGENLRRYSDEFVHPNSPGIKKLSNVQHLYTPVRAKIKKGVSRTEVLAKLHPTPAVGGYPRSAAVPYIPMLEDFKRGWYAGPIGWINAQGEGEFVVAIRSGLIKKDEVLLFAGCGIIENSDPAREWDETNLKLIPMLTALEYARK